MIPLSLVFALIAFCGVMLYKFTDDFNYKKLGIYIFLVNFLLVTLQVQIDYPNIGSVGAGLILFAVALFIFYMALDLLKMFQFLVEWINKRR